MPVTAKLSRKFYDRFGDDVTTELVDWFNSVDTEYRTQLRELNELNWQRFKAEMHSVISQSEARLRTEVSGVRVELAVVKGELLGETLGLEGRLRAEIQAVRSEMIKWMFIFWTGTVIPLASLILAVR